MNYTLMHGNIPVCILSEGMKIIEILCLKEFPLGIYSDNRGITEGRLQTWLSHRTIPNHRVFAERIRECLGYSFTEALINTHGQARGVA